MILFILLFNLLIAVENYYYPYNDYPAKEVFQERREKLREMLHENELYIAFSSDFYSNEKHNKFRQNSDLLYFAGFPYKNSILVISKSGIDIDGMIYKELIITERQDNNAKKWESTIADKSQIKDFSGIEEVYYNSEIYIDDIFKGVTDLAISPYSKGDNFKPYFGSKSDFIESNIDFFKDVKNKFPFLIIDLDLKRTKILRQIKDENEIKLIKKAVGISVKAHNKVIKNINNYNYEYEIEGEFVGEFLKNGAENTAYNSIVGSGINTCILHYTTNRAKINKNDLILFDCGAEYHGYASDITRTVPASGKFTTEQKIIYNIVLEAQKRAINHCKPGVKFNSVDSVARYVIDSALISMGLITTTSQSRLYFPHGTSHYLGLDVHDVGDYGDLKVGNVITVEPGIYIPENSPCDKKWWNIGVRIEDDILITEDGCEVLSKDLPKEINELEKMME